MKWRQRRSKVIFGHSKWPPATILWILFRNMKVAYLSEMARNAIESDFRSSKMAAGGHFVTKSPPPQSSVLIWNREKCHLKWLIGHPNWSPAAILWIKKKLCIDMKCQEMRSKAIFAHPKWPPSCDFFLKLKAAYWYEMAKSDFRSSKTAWNGENHIHASKTKLLQFVRGASWNWLDYCPSEVFG